MPLTMVNAGEPNVIRKVGGKEETEKIPGKSGVCGRRCRDGGI